MTIKQTLEIAYLSWLSRPAADRVLYRHLRKHRIHSIVELGIASPERCLRMIRLARYGSPEHEVRYSAIDLFEARPADQPRITLKQTHQRLASSGATVRLIPGDAASGLARAANHLQGTQLLLIGPHHDPERMARAWSYVPRMLTPDGRVLVASPANSDQPWQFLSMPQVEQLAEPFTRRRRAA